GSLCINTDITNLLIAEKTIQEQTNIEIERLNREEVITNDVNEILETLIKESIIHVGLPVASMNKEQKTKGLKYLDEKGAFLIKKARDRISEVYEISKFTVYNYLE